MRSRSRKIKSLLNAQEEETRCSLGGCASEYISLIPELYKRKIRQLISFVPNVCSVPVEAGSVTVCDIGHKGLIRDFDSPFLITNVYLNSQNPISEEELFSQVVIKQHTVA